MNRTELKDTIKRYFDVKAHLIRSRNGLYECPFCGSGTGTHKTGAVKYYPDTNTICCFGRCAPTNSKGEKDKKGKRYDALDLIQKIYGVDYNGALQKGAELLNISPDARERPVNAFSGKGTQIHAPTPKTPQNAPERRQEPQQKDLTEYFNRCHNNLITSPGIPGMDYLRSRGISLVTVGGFERLGFDPVADPAGSGYKCPRIIVGTSKTHYMGRRIDGRADYEKMNNRATPGIFNEKALYDKSDVVFVCEGWADALSVSEAVGDPYGMLAIAINGTNNTSELVKLLQERPTKARLILILDADPAGRASVKRLKAELDMLGIICIVYDITEYCLNGEKDLNDLLQADPDMVRNIIAEAVEEVRGL